MLLLLLPLLLLDGAARGLAVTGAELPAAAAPDEWEAEAVATSVAGGGGADESRLRKLWPSAEACGRTGGGASIGGASVATATVMRVLLPNP
jgi:hypothetical protein